VCKYEFKTNEIISENVRLYITYKIDALWKITRIICKIGDNFADFFAQTVFSGEISSSRERSYRKRKNTTTGLWAILLNERPRATMLVSRWKMESQD